MEDVTKIQKNIDLIKLNISELLEMSKTVQSYLQSHEPDPSKGCEIDLNDRPFDETAYKEQRQLLNSILVEYFSRPVEEGVEIKL